MLTAKIVVCMVIALIGVIPALILACVYRREFPHTAIIFLIIAAVAVLIDIGMWYS